MGRPVGLLDQDRRNTGAGNELAYPDLVGRPSRKFLRIPVLPPEDIDGVVYGSMPSMMEGVA